MSNNHDDGARIGPEELAREARAEAQAEAEYLAGSQAAFGDLGKIQRLACNRTPTEIKKEILVGIAALMSHHSVALRALADDVTNAAVAGGAELDDVATTLEAATVWAIEKDRLQQAMRIICLVDCTYDPPDPDEMDESHFRYFKQPATEDSE